MKEVWTTHRGSTETVYSGNSTSYYCDGIPVKKNEICDAEGNYIELVDGVPTKKEISSTGLVDSSSTAGTADDGISPKTSIRNSGEDVNIKLSDRDTESVSNRSLLANAFEGVAQTEWERQKIQEYRESIGKMNAEERKLRELKAQIKELSFAKGPRDRAKLSALRDEATMTANRISNYDNQLLRLEASKPLQDVLAREKQKAYRKAADRGRQVQAEYRDRKKKTVMRHKIQGVVDELNRLLLNESKNRHVPDSMKKAVAEALDLVNMDTVGAEERAAKYAALIEKETDPDKIEAYRMSMENILRQGEKMGERLKALRDAYEEIETCPDIFYKTA